MRFILLAVLALVTVTIQPITAEAAAFPAKFTQNTDVDTTAEQISSSSDIASCVKLVVCAHETNLDGVYIGSESSNLDLSGIPLYGSPASGNTCYTFEGYRNAGRGKLAYDGRKLYAQAIIANSRVSITCEP